MHTAFSTDLTTFKVKGSLVFDEVMVVVKSFYEGEPTSNVLWDLIDTSEIKITSDQLQKIVDFQPRYEGTRASGKTAFAAKQDLEFGLSRVFQAHSRIKDAPYAIGVFRSTQDAMDWLEED